MIAVEIEKVGLPIVQITAVPTVAQMVGVNRILRGQTVPCVVGDSSLTENQEISLRRRIVSRVIEILQMDAVGPSMVFTLDGTE